MSMQLIEIKSNCSKRQRLQQSQFGYSTQMDFYLVAEIVFYRDFKSISPVWWIDNANFVCEKNRRIKNWFFGGIFFNDSDNNVPIWISIDIPLSLFRLRHIGYPGLSLSQWQARHNLCNSKALRTLWRLGSETVLWNGRHSHSFRWMQRVLDKFVFCSFTFFRIDFYYLDNRFGNW